MISITRLLLGLDSMPGSGFLCAVSAITQSIMILYLDCYAHNDGSHNEIEDTDDDITMMFLVDEDHRGGFVDP